MSVPVMTLDLRPGDCLLYRTTGTVGWLIRTKTWSPVNHAEAVVSGRLAVAARRSGIDIYPIAARGLYAILRPTDPFDEVAAMEWFMAVARGQSYHLWGLLRFFNLGRTNTETHQQFCSELLTRWYRKGGFHPFGPCYDADKTSPGMFLSSPHFTTVWTRSGSEV